MKKATDANFAVVQNDIGIPTSGAKQYYPAFFVCEAATAHEALAVLGIVGEEADFSLANEEINPDRPVVFEVVFHDPEMKLSDQPISKSAVVLIEHENGLVGLWLGVFKHLKDSPQEALNALADELMADPPEEVMEVEIFEWDNRKGHSNAVH